MYPSDKRMRRALTAVSALFVLAAAAGPALAHHSLAMFDRSREVSVQGTVTEWQWTNPHTWIELAVLEKGKVVHYSIEGNSPNMLNRHGWHRTVLAPGDKVTVVMWPYKNGDKGGIVRQVTLADGKVLTP